MLGRTLTQQLSEHELAPVDLDDFDLADAKATLAAVKHFRPEVVLHTAAMTAVDLCESSPDDAFRANAVGSANIAMACSTHDCRLIAFSTDYVFSGAIGRPWHEWDNTNPQNIYGHSKLAGEQAIAKHCHNHLICRLAWLYGSGGPSFLHAMLKQGRSGNPAIKVVNDQFGNPTSTLAVANYIRILLDVPIVGIMHLTCEGETTWYDFAKKIFALWGIKNQMTPCNTSEFPRPAKRPMNSCLEKRIIRILGLPPMPDWLAALKEFHRDYPTE